MLSPRELEAMRNPRIQVKNARDCFNAIRNEMSWERRVLDESTIQKIVEAYERHRPETYSPHYNTANFFIAEHVAAKVGEKVRLTPREIVHIKNLFGRLYYDPPDKFKDSSKKSAEKLHALGGKGQQIFEEAKKALEELDEIDLIRAIGTGRNKTLPAHADMFANPSVIYNALFASAKNFGELKRRP